LKKLKLNIDSFPPKSRNLILAKIADIVKVADICKVV
jgi:hypothetical protein